MNRIMDVKVTVSALTGAGKTSVMFLIKEALEARGISVKVEGLDENLESPILHYLKKGEKMTGNVTLEEKNIPRTAFQKKLADIHSRSEV